MIYFLAFLSGLAGAVIGYLFAAGLGAVIAPMLGITGFEGTSGYFAGFMVGPIGGICSATRAVTAA